MRNLYSLALLFFLLGCNKDHVDPLDKNPGVVEGFLKDHPKIVIKRTTESDIIYTGGVATHRGYVFSPRSNMKLTAIGGRIGLNGIFRVEMFEVGENVDWTYGIPVMVTDSLKIDNINKFQFKNIEAVSLIANKHYLLRYFNLNHESVYDAGLGVLTDTTNYIDFPVTIRDIKIEVPYFSYEQKQGSIYYTYIEGSFSAGIFRGLIDFKYELSD